MRRLDQYKKALAVLPLASEQDLENEFSPQFELGWKLLKEPLRYEDDVTAATE